MAQIPHVQPGDIISSELINQIIDALGGLDVKITKCCEEHAKEPQPEQPKGRIFITEVVSPDPVYGEVVNIIGGGFMPNEKGNEVTIANEPVTKFGNVTESLIQAAVPTTIPYKKRTPAAVFVENSNGVAKYGITVGPQKKPDVVWVPTDDKVVEEMLKLADVKKGDILYDLGSGDGRIVIAAAESLNIQKGVGIELDDDLIKRARDRAKKSKVADRVEFRQEDLFEADFSEATVISLYLTPELNLKLRPRLQKLKPGTRIVSHSFDMDDWDYIHHSKTSGKEVFVWVVGK